MSLETTSLKDIAVIVNKEATAKWNFVTRFLSERVYVKAANNPKTATVILIVIAVVLFYRAWKLIPI